MGILYGTDISSAQANLDVSKLKVSFVIIKATQSTNYVNPYCNRHWGQSKNKLKGLYHFLVRGNARAQAQFFVKNIKNYVGKAMLCVDVEVNPADGTKPTVQDTLDFLDELYKLTGVRGVIYCGLSDENSMPWGATGKTYALWVAQYNNNNPMGFADPALYGGVKNWPAITIHQYTSTGRIAGYNGDLDLNVFYGDANAWNKFTKPVNTSKPSEPSKPKPSVPSYSVKGKSLEQIANDVLANKVSSGATRAKLLGNYNVGVQAIVNGKVKAWTNAHVIDVLANETKANRYGTGDGRKKLLGSYYNGVQASINKSAVAKVYYTVKSGDTVSGIALKYKTSSSAIVRLNGLANANKIYIGQKLRVK